MGVPKEAVDFMCVDGAEIGSVNLLMAGAREGSGIIPARPRGSLEKHCKLAARGLLSFLSLLRAFLLTVIKRNQAASRATIY